MKNIVITQKLPHGARYGHLCNNFKVNINIEDDVLFIDFINEQSDELLFGTFRILDHKYLKSFDDFSEDGQEMLLDRLRECIITDISNFVSGEYKGDSDPAEPYHEVNGCMDMDAYLDLWASYYDLISDDDDILDEYTDPEEEGEEES